MSRFTTPPGGNKIFMTCECGVDPIEICRRSSLIYAESKEFKYHFDQWLDRHAGCGKGADHFRIGLEREPNWDQAIDAGDVPNSVRLALVNGS